MGIIDSIISVFSPSTALRRARNMKALDAVRAYDAAGSGHRNSWRSSGSSANTEIRNANSKLRDRSRELARNNAYYKKALDVVPANVVGTGIQPSIHLKASRVQRDLRASWKSWAESTAADFNQRKTFYSIQSIALRSMLESGDVFIRKFIDRGADGKAVLKLQVLEADYLDNTRDSISGAGGGNYIRAGIEYNSAGLRAAYWFWQEHPGESIRRADFVSRRVPAEQVIHLYREERPGQESGVPFGVSAMNRIRDFDEYEDAQLMRQKIAACFAVFITSDAHTVTPASIGKGSSYDLEVVEPGMIERLRPGEQVSFGSPPSTDGYKDYSSQVLRGAAAGMGVTYEGMTGDYSQVNFSSGRMGWIEFSRIVEQMQYHLLIPILCERVFVWFVDIAKDNGVISESSRPSVTWTAPRREFIDPLKEVKALTEQVRNGFISWQEAVRSMGYDPEEIRTQAIEDAGAFDAAGLKPASDPRYDPEREKAAERDKDKKASPPD